MAMTLRLDDELDQKIGQLAHAQGLSKQQLLIVAARQYLEREARTARTVANADRIIAENTGLLDRLSR